MLGLSHFLVLKSIFNKQSQPSGYTNHVSCSVLWRVPRCLIVYFSCTLPLLAYFISRMWLDFGDICSSRFCLVSVSKFSVRILFANSMLSPFRFYASWASLTLTQSILSKLVGDKEGGEGGESYPEVCRSDLWINVLRLNMGCVLFYSGIFSLGHFRYQFGRSGTGFLNNTRYSVCDGVPGSA